MSSSNDNMYSKEVQERFWSKVATTENQNECWIWTGSKKRSGHGSFHLGRLYGKTKNIDAHRFSYIVSKGEIPEGLLIRHLCNNASCVNPRHLVIGNFSQNMKDRQQPIPDWIILVDPTTVAATTEQQILSRFWIKVDIKGEDECWEWNAYLNKKGYGEFVENGKRILAHRFSYKKCNGEIPNGMLVCHSCDNPKCVNPKHLWIGDDKSNSDDKISKGRQYNPFVKGHSYAKRKYTDEQYNYVYELRERGLSHEKIAKITGINRRYIGTILKGIRVSLLGKPDLSNHQFKITTEDIDKMFELNRNGLNQREIAEIIKIIFGEDHLAE